MNTFHKFTIILLCASTQHAAHAMDTENRKSPAVRASKTPEQLQLMERINNLPNDCQRIIVTLFTEAWNQKQAQEQAIERARQPKHTPKQYTARECMQAEFEMVGNYRHDPCPMY